MPRTECSRQSARESAWLCRDGWGQERHPRIHHRVTVFLEPMGCGAAARGSLMPVSPRVGDHSPSGVAISV